ncbi:MAG: universal stress protein [Acidobacteria bacterium]|nr:universal stress protein [Acidobacteriota bacterium]
MTTLMKILIAYDGSECADIALDDLLRAGLPSKAEAKVVSVAEQVVPFPATFGMVETDFVESLLPEFANLKEQTEFASSKLKVAFPEWKVMTVVGVGSPSSFIINQADEWKPDLVVVGSHGRSAIGRLFLGSVSLKLVHDSPCSVRIARRHAETESDRVKLLLAIDGSRDSEEAAREVVVRQWPIGSEVRLVNATWGYSPALSSSSLQPIAQWMAKEKARIGAMMGRVEEELRAAGFTVTSVVKEGDAKTVLLDEAEAWKADCIFIGSKGTSPIERLMVGSVSSAVATHAPCSVEIVRRPR